MPETEVGEFYAGRCFIILYSYMDDSKVKSISYFWEGLFAPPSDYISYDHGLYERLVEKMEDEGGGPPKKIRYRQYAEVILYSFISLSIILAPSCCLFKKLTLRVG